MKNQARTVSTGVFVVVAALFLQREGMHALPHLIVAGALTLLPIYLFTRQRPSQNDTSALPPA